MTGEPGASSTPQGSVFGRGETALAHGVYGLILTMATLGELLHLDASAKTSVEWLLGAGAVLLAAHLFADLLAHLAATRDDLHWSETLSIGSEDVAVTAGALGAALFMALAGLAGVNSNHALSVCVVLGLVSLAALSVYATVNHRWWTRLTVGIAAVGLGGIIVILENSV